MFDNNTLTINKEVEKNTIFALEVSEVGKAFLGTMVAKGNEYYGVSCQARTEEEIKANFELFKSGFQKLAYLISEGIQKSVQDDKKITLKEMRVLSGVHPAILAEQLGISINRLKRLEDGESMTELTWEQAFTFYQSTYVKGNKIDFIQWKANPQKNAKR